MLSVWEEMLHGEHPNVHLSHSQSEIGCLCGMKLCHRGMPVKTFNRHDLHVCKQQQIASGNKTCKIMFSVPDYETWYTGTQYHSNVNVYGYNLVV